jgi:hypothetical protein
MKHTAAPFTLNAQPAKRAPASLAMLALAVLMACFIALGASDAGAKNPKKHHAAAPAGPTLPTLQRLQCAKYNCDANTTITNLKVLSRGKAHRGSGRTARAGGDGIPTNTWIYPELMSYDETVTGGHYTGGGYSPLVWVVTHSTTHTREKDNVLRDPTGAFVLRFVASSSTCEPDPNGCTSSIGGGA